MPAQESSQNLRAWLLVALPSLGYTYLSARHNQFLIQHQYFAPALGWLVVGAVQGQGVWSRLCQRLPLRLAPRWWPAALGLPLAFALVATIAIDAGLSPIKLRFFSGHPFREDLVALRRIIEPEASLSVTDRLAPAFAHRRDYFLALDFILNRELNAALGLPDYRDTMFHLFDLSALRGSQDRERRVAQLLADERYGVRYYRFPLVLFERGRARNPEPKLEALLSGVGEEGPGVVRAFPAVFLDTDDGGSVERDLGVSGRGATMRFVPGRRGRVFGPGITLPAGSYTAEFQLTLEAPAAGLIADLDVVSIPANRRRSGPRRLAAVDFTGPVASRSCSPSSSPARRPVWTSGRVRTAQPSRCARSWCETVPGDGTESWSTVPSLPARPEDDVPERRRHAELAMRRQKMMLQMVPTQEAAHGCPQRAAMNGVMHEIVKQIAVHESGEAPEPGTAEHEQEHTQDRGADRERHDHRRGQSPHIVGIRMVITVNEIADDQPATRRRRVMKREAMSRILEKRPGEHAGPVPRQQPDRSSVRVGTQPNQHRTQRHV
jgi:hypothetical protein